MTRNIHKHLAEHRQIAVIWSIEDVIAIRPDFTDEQAWDVLQAARRYHDADIGIHWQVLASHADVLFGPEPETATGTEG
jgi:hypothetical protein